jgi:putative ABC transport system permease protein
MIGTWLLFTAGSIALLKMLRKNKRYYYKPGHFMAVSGLLYRMKRNAIGMANICILATMVLVMVSTTASLYIGMEDLLQTRYPTEETITSWSTVDPDALSEAVETSAKAQGVGLTDFSTIQYFTAVSGEIVEDGTFDLDASFLVHDENKVFIVEVVTAEQFQNQTGETLALAADEIGFGSTNGVGCDTVKIGEKRYTVAANADAAAEEFYNYYTVDRIVLVVPDQADFLAAYDCYQATLTDTVNSCKTQSTFNLVDAQGNPLSSEENIAVGKAIAAQVKKLLSTEEEVPVSLESREENRAEFLLDYGMLLFLGLFLSLTFTAATVLMLYYKQLIEGYEDQRSYRIMQQVGMSRKEVRGSIRSQVVLVFFLPLLMAGAHMAVAYPMLCPILNLMNLTNTKLFSYCCLAVYALFALGYFIAYLITSKVYERLVSAPA